MTSILGSTPGLRPELYNSDPWVEFIELDMEEQNDRLRCLDTDCLVQRSLSSTIRDDDSGRASCCDPDLHSDPEASHFHPLIPNHIPSDETACRAASEPVSPVQGPAGGELAFDAPGREALYTQVSEVRVSGKVLLSPEEQMEVEETTSKDTGKDFVAEKEKEKEFQLLVVNPDNQGYTSEVNAGRMSSSVFAGDEQRQTGGDSSCVPSPLPYHKSDPVAPPLLPPVYTVVEGVDRQNSLLLTNSNSTPAPHLIIQKNMPTPGGYLTPDLLGNIQP